MAGTVQYVVSPVAGPVTTHDMKHHTNHSQPKPERSSPHWYRWLTVLIGIVMGGGFLFLTMRRVDLAEVEQALQGAHLHWLFPLILVQIGIFWVRGVRWATLFPPGHRPSSFRAFSAFLVNLLVNNILPGRIGEVLRIWVIRRHIPMVSLSSILATVVLERVLDGLVLVGLLGIVLVIAPLPVWVEEVGMIGGALILSLFIILLLLTRRGATSLPLIDGSSDDKGVFTRLWRIVQSLLRQFTQGLSALSNGRILAVVSMQSLLIWVGEAVVIDFMFRIFGLSLPFSAATVTLVVLSLGLIIPSAPGFIGSYQFFIMSSLDIYKVPEAPSLAVGLVFNLFVFILSTLLGLLALFFEWPFFWSRHQKTHLSSPEEYHQEEHR